MQMFVQLNFKSVVCPTLIFFFGNTLRISQKVQKRLTGLSVLKYQTRQMTENCTNLLRDIWCMDLVVRKTWSLLAWKMECAQKDFQSSMLRQQCQTKMGILYTRDVRILEPYWRKKSHFTMDLFCHIIGLYCKSTKRASMLSYAIRTSQSNICSICEQRSW